MADPLRIGLLALHWEYFDSIMPPEFRQEKEAISQTVAGILSANGIVVYEGLLTGEAEGRRQAGVFQERGVDCVVVFVHMAAPGAFPWEVMRELRVPVLIWNAHLERAIPDDYDMPDLCRKSSNVGTLMLTNVLVREGRTFTLVTGWFDDARARGRIAAFLRAASVSARLRHARVGVLGEPMPGYLDVAIDPRRLENEIGPRCVACSREAWWERFESVRTDEVQALVADLKRNFTVVELSHDELERSARLALALELWMEQESLDAAAINCHTDYFRHSDHVGIVACLGASRQTSQGRPIACTGDVPTTIAMLIGKWLGSATLYCECDLIDYEKDTVALANTGECDYGLCERDCRVQLQRNVHFGRGGGAGLGACHFLNVARGPGTLLGFSPNARARGGWSLIAAPGVILGTKHIKLTVGNCEFRFARVPAAEAFDAWAQAGATHHGVLCTGDLREEISCLAAMLKIDGTVIT